MIEVKVVAMDMEMAAAMVDGDEDDDLDEPATKKPKLPGSDSRTKIGRKTTKVITEVN